jgi:N-acetylglucosaminyl-diphospho-decaprenol L-rhamnosyltransferase
MKQCRITPPLHDLLISVVNHDNLEMLLRCLATIPEACAAHSWTCVVVDNVPGTGAPDVLAERYPNIEVIRNAAPKGFGANHNFAVARALDEGSVRYVLALNDDTLLEPGSIDALIDRMDADATLGAVGPSMVDGKGTAIRGLTPFPSATRTVVAAVRGHIGPAPSTGEGWLNGACLLLRASAFAGVGGWDEEFFLFYEDTDLGLRLLRAGWQVAVVREARVVHLEHSTVGRDSLSRQLHNLKARYRYFRKHRGLIVATATNWGARIGLFVRAIKAGVEAMLGRRPASFASMLLRLALFNPKQDVPALRSIGQRPEGTRSRRDSRS